MRTPEERQAERAAQEAAVTAQQDQWNTYNTLSDADFLAQFQPTYDKPISHDNWGEQSRYVDAGFTDPWLAREWYQYRNSMGDTPSWLQKAWDSNDAAMDPVGTLGQRIARRGDMPDFTSSEEALKGTYGSFGGGDTGYLSYVPKALGLSADPAMASWMGNNTAAAQAARDDDGGLFGSLGGLGQLAMLAALVYSGGAAAGAWGAGEGALAAGAGELMGPTLGGELLMPSFVEPGLGMMEGINEVGQLGYANPVSASSVYTPSALESAGNWLDKTTSNPLVKGVSNVRKGLTAADSLSKMINPEERPTSVSGLAQYQQQPQQGYQPSRAFGYNNFNAVRG